LKSNNSSTEIHKRDNNDNNNNNNNNNNSNHSKHANYKTISIPVGLQEFRMKQDMKRMATAMALRSYHKVMKQYGYNAGHGAS
jgi:hypothetical protein